MGSKDDSQSNISLTHDLREKFAHWIVSNKSDNLDNLPLDLIIVEGMANVCCYSRKHTKESLFLTTLNSCMPFSCVQDFEKILKKTFAEQEEDPRTLLHKNLWIDAQVKLFAMKYELQLARAELELLKQNHCAKGQPSHISSNSYVIDCSEIYC